MIDAFLEACQSFFRIPSSLLFSVNEYMFPSEVSFRKILNVLLFIRSIEMNSFSGENVFPCSFIDHIADPDGIICFDSFLKAEFLKLNLGIFFKLIESLSIISFFCRLIKIDFYIAVASFKSNALDIKNTSARSDGYLLKSEANEIFDTFFGSPLSIAISSDAHLDVKLSLQHPLNSPTNMIINHAIFDTCQVYIIYIFLLLFSTLSLVI